MNFLFDETELSNSLSTGTKLTMSPLTSDTLYIAHVKSIFVGMNEFQTTSILFHLSLHIQKSIAL